MKHKTNILLIILLISSLFLILIPKSVVGSINDISYSFENDVLYSDDSLNFNDNWNVRNKTILTQNYTASYFNTNDTIGGLPLGWDDNSGGSCSVEIIDNLVGHNKVFQLNDTDGSNAWSNNYFDTPQNYGTIEFWWQTTDITKTSYMMLYNGGTIVAYIHVQASQWHYNGIGVIPNIPNPVNNKWYPITIHFECTGSSYQGLAQYKFEVIGNGISSGVLAFSSNEGQVDIVKLLTNSAHSGYFAYSDAMGYNWLSNYSIGVNYVPFIQTNTSIKENDVFPFTYESFDTFEDPYEANDNKFDSWQVIDENNNELSHQIKLGWSSGLVYYEPDVASDQFGLQKDFNIATANTINITWSILIEATDLFSSHLNTYIYSEDITELMKFTLAKDADSIYLSDTDATIIIDNLAINTIYSFNLYINLNDEIIILNCYENNTIDNTNPTLIETFIRDTENHNQAGLGLVIFHTGAAPDPDTSMYLDYIGVYVDEVSQSDQYGLLKINTANFIGGNTFNLHNHNLLTFDVIGNASIRLPETVGGFYIAGIFLCKRLTDLEIYSGIEQQCIYFKRDNDYLETSPIIFLEIYDYVEFTSLTIEGSKLIQGSNEYWLELEQGNIDLTESYFYVDTNNKLQFTLITNDTNTEYIQATFDIPNLSTTDRAISFRGFRLNKAYGYFVVDYLAGLTTVDIPVIEKTTRSILPTNKTIDNFIVLITDNDDDIILGTTIGYVSQPTLLSISGIGLPIITAGLIEMMIPLLLIMIPTLIISQGFGKEGKKLLIPLFLVFSLIATITEIIPIWIFFIIAFGNSLFLFRNKEIEG